MRLIVLPLTSKKSMIYCQKLLAPTTNAKPSLIDKSVTKSAKIWLNMQNSDKNWKKKITKWGDAILETIPYDEWGLKSIPPAKKYMRRLKADYSTHVPMHNDIDQSELHPIDLCYPTTIMSFARVQSHLKLLSDRGLEDHRKKMVYCLIGLPLTLPIALIPIVPNLPGFFLLYRLYSHYVAYKGAQHLKILLENHHLHAQKLPALDETYKTFNGAVLPEHQERIKRIFECPELSQELERAIKQVAKTK